MRILPVGITSTSTILSSPKAHDCAFAVVLGDLLDARDPDSFSCRVGWIRGFYFGVLRCHDRSDYRAHKRRQTNPDCGWLYGRLRSSIQCHLLGRHRNQNFAGCLAAFKITIGLGSVNQRIAMPDSQTQPTLPNPAEHFFGLLDQTLAISGVMSERRAG